MKLSALTSQVDVAFRDELESLFDNSAATTTSSLVTLSFERDTKIETDVVYQLLKDDKLTSSQVQLLGIPLDILYKVRQYPKEKNLLTPYIEKAYEKYETELLKQQILVEENWQKLRDMFFFEVENACGYKFRFKKLKCHISLTHPTATHSYVNKTVILGYQFIKDSNYTVAHELFHIYYKKLLEIILDRKYIAQLDEDLMEVTVHFALLKERRLSKFFNKEFTLLLIAPRFRTLAKKMLPLYVTKSSFKQFLQNAYVFKRQTFYEKLS